jgi:hypothetical protein
LDLVAEPSEDFIIPDEKDTEKVATKAMLHLNNEEGW